MNIALPDVALWHLRWTLGPRGPIGRVSTVAMEMLSEECLWYDVYVHRAKGRGSHGPYANLP
jgi:hypothetical protein